jgi:hypothetical protein
LSKVDEAEAARTIRPWSERLCDALHIAVEFNHPIIEKRLAFPAIPLMTDIATYDGDQ